MLSASSRGSSARLALVVLWCASLLLAVLPGKASPQGHSALGGDASGPPSNVSVNRVKGQPYNPSGAVSGSAMLFDGSGWNAQGLPAAGSSTTQYPLLFYTLTSTPTAIFIGTTAVTVSSILVPSANVTPPFKLSHMYLATVSVTAAIVTGTAKWFVNGRQVFTANASWGTATRWQWLIHHLAWYRSGGPNTGMFLDSASQNSGGTFLAALAPLNIGGVMITPGIADALDVLLEVTFSVNNNNPGNLMGTINDDLRIWK